MDDRVKENCGISSGMDAGDTDADMEECSDLSTADKDVVDALTGLAIVSGAIFIFLKLVSSHDCSWIMASVITLVLLSILVKPFRELLFVIYPMIKAFIKLTGWLIIGVEYVIMFILRLFGRLRRTN